MGRTLGLSDSEFWNATYAEIAMLFRVKVHEWDKRRDFFIAQLVAMKASSAEKTYSADDILAFRYPPLHGQRAPEFDPDFGAQADIPSLKKFLKGGG